MVSQNLRNRELDAAKISQGSDKHPYFLTFNFESTNLAKIIIPKSKWPLNFWTQKRYQSIRAVKLPSFKVLRDFVRSFQTISQGLDFLKDDLKCFENDSDVIALSDFILEDIRQTIYHEHITDEERDRFQEKVSRRTIMKPTM